MNAVSPYIIAVFSVVCYAIMPVLFKKLQINIPPLAVIAITMFFLSMFAASASVCFEKGFLMPKLGINIWMALLFVGFLNFVGFAAFMMAAAKIPIAHYQIIYAAAPIVSAAVAYWLLNEPFKMQYLIGVGFIAVGLFIALREWAK